MKKRDFVPIYRGMKVKTSRLLALGAWVLVLSAPLSAVADEHEVETYSPSLLQCLAAATTPEARTACKGVMSTACMEGEDGGYSTYGMVRCTAAETQVRDKFLNASYQKQMQGMHQMDASEATQFPEFAHRAKALRDVQRAWVIFRDAECGLAYAMWGAGSMRQIAGASCVLEMTADRAIVMESLGEEMR